MHPDGGIELTTWVCALTGNRTCDLLVYWTTLQPTEPPGEGDSQLLNKLKFYAGSEIILLLKDFQFPRFNLLKLCCENNSIFRNKFIVF